MGKKQKKEHLKQQNEIPEKTLWIQNSSLKKKEKNQLAPLWAADATTTLVWWNITGPIYPGLEADLTMFKASVTVLQGSPLASHKQREG